MSTLFRVVSDIPNPPCTTITTTRGRATGNSSSHRRRREWISIIFPPRSFPWKRGHSSSSSFMLLVSSSSLSFSSPTVHSPAPRGSGFPSMFKATKLSPPLPRTHDKMEGERDPISLLNERIIREHGKRDSSSPSPPHLDSQETEKYIQLVKEQQQRGLQKLKGDATSNRKDGVFSYKVDPYTLRPGDYVVHKKVGIGRFVGIKFDLPKHSAKEDTPIEYVFIEYADGMAKLPVKQASRFLYRYNLPNEMKKPRTLSKLSDPAAWERRRVKGKVAVQKMVVDLMELYIHRLKQKRPPYPKTAAMAEFASQFPYEPTPDQKQV